jgi:hypothetical protein
MIRSCHVIQLPPVGNRCYGMPLHVPYVTLHRYFQFESS